MNQISQIKKAWNIYQVILENGTIRNVSDLIVLDFDGAQNVTYRNETLNVTVSDINVVASLEAETQAAVIDQLNATPSKVYYLTQEDVAALNLPAGTYSTIYVGDTNDLDKLGNAFTGIAETTGAEAVANKADNAFVLTNRIDDLDELVAVIAHEAGHLAGSLAHDYGQDGATLDDYMRTTTSDRVYVSADHTSNIAAGTTLSNCHKAGDSTVGSHNQGQAAFIQETGILNVNGAEGADNIVIFVSNVNKFSGTTSTNARTAKGGAITNSGKLVVTWADFSNNSVNNSATLPTGTSYNRYGGALCNYGSATLTHANFSSNGTTGKGGAIFNVGVDAGATYSGILDVTSATFDGNTAALAGGGLYNQTGSASLTHVTFSSNKTGDGGAIYNAGSATITSATFIGNSATQHGGAIYNNDFISATSATFNSNSATQCGGAIYNNASAHISGNVLFSENSAKDGGAIMNGTGGDMTLNNVSFEKNYASGDTIGGGAINNAETLSATNVTFTSNNALAKGGAILNQTGKKVFLQDTIFSDNSAGQFGGAIDNHGSATISNATFTNNSALTGGAIYNSNVASVSISGGTFNNNIANFAGALLNKGSATISNALFDGNIASKNLSEGNGGAILTSDYLSVYGGTLTHNSAVDRGGAIFITTSGSARVESAVFSDNNAASGGGAIFNAGSVTLLGGNVFSSSTDTIFNKGSYDSDTHSTNIAALTFSGANTLGGSLTNSTYGTVTFDGGATTTLTNSAVLINGNTTTQTLGGTLVVDHTDTKGYTSGNLADTILEGNWGVIGGTTTVDVIVASGTTRTATLGSSFLNDDDTTKLWFGSNNGKTGITDNTLVLNGDTADTDVDYATFKTLANLNNTYDNFDGIINVTGGSYSSHLYGNQASLTFTEDGADMGTKYILGGRLVSVADESAVLSNSISISANVTAKAVAAGNYFAPTYTKDSALSLSMTNEVSVTSGTNNFTSFLAAGSLVNGKGDSGNASYTFTGSNSISVSNTNTFAKVVVGGSLVGGKSALTDNSENSITLSAGTYTYVCGAGYIQNNTCSLAREAESTTKITILGGTYTGGIYGGAAAQKAEQLVHATIAGTISITVDSSANDVYASNIYGGCSGNAQNFTATTTITFTGDGSKLHFANSNNVVGAGNGTVNAYKHAANTVHTLVFDEFSGSFGAYHVQDFTKVTFDSESTKTVTFANALNLADVKEWTFDENTDLVWANGVNDFKGDTLKFECSGARTVITGGSNDDRFKGWDDASTCVYFNDSSKKATWNDTNKCWTGNGYSLSVTAEHKMVITTLA